MKPLRKEARIGSEELREEGSYDPPPRKSNGEVPIPQSMKQSLHYFFLGFSVLSYRTVQCEDACIVVSVCRFSRQSRHLLSGCLIVQ